MPPVITFDPETPTIADLRFMYYGGGAGSTVSDSEYDYLLSAYLQNIQADDILMLGYNGNGSPEGVVFAPRGAMYSDLATGSKYNKTTAETLNTGWVLGSAGGGGGGVVNTIVAGPGISVNNTNPAAPVITAEVPQTEFDAHVNSVTAHAAINLTFPTGTGGIAATNVRDAIVVASTMGPVGSGIPGTIIDAQGVLGGILDDTPVFFPVGVNRILGRSVAGNVGQQTTAQLAAMFGTPDGTKFLADDGTLKTPAGGGGGVSFPLTSTGATAATDALLLDVTGDTQKRFIINYDGSMDFSGGSGSLDFTFKRFYAGVAGTAQVLQAQHFFADTSIQHSSTNGNYITFSNGGPVVALGRASAQPVLVAKGAAGQTASLQEWQDSSGNVLSKVLSNGALVVPTGNSMIQFGNTAVALQYSFSVLTTVVGSADRTAVGTGGAAATGIFTIYGAGVSGSYCEFIPITTPGALGLVIKGAAAQTGALISLKDSADVTIFNVKPAGSIGKAGSIEQRYNTVAASGATRSIDVSLYGVFDITMDQNCTFTFDNAPIAGECSTFMLTLRGAFTPTLPASIKWPDGAAPSYTTPSVFVFTRDTAGTFWMGSRVGKAFA